MKQKPGLGKIRLAILLGLPVLIIIVLVFIALTGVNTFLKPVIKNALAKLVVDGSDSLYQFQLKDYSIGPGGRSVIINELDIRVDSSRYKLLKAAGLLPPLVFSIRVNQASVTGLNPWQLWRHRNIICKSVVLKGAKVNLLQQVKKRIDTSGVVVSKNFYELIKPDINNIEVRRINVSNADVTFRTIFQQSGQDSYWHLENTGVILDDILVNSTSHNDSSKVLYANNLVASVGSLKTSSSSAIYQFSTNNAAYDFKKRKAIIAGLAITPAISKTAFYKRMGHEADLFTILIPGLTIEGFNPDSLISNNKLFASLVTLENPDIDIYKDRRAGRDYRNKMGKYPHQLLAKAEMNISIKKLAIRNGKLVVSQKSAKTGETGSFRFTAVNGRIENISNQAIDIRANQWCKAFLSAYFLGDNAMNTVFAFDLASPNGHFITDASLTSLRPGNINPVFRALARAELETFNLEKMVYHVEGNDNAATGNLTFRYRDLKLNVLKEDKNGNLKKKGMVSLLANLAKLYNHNPMPGKEERKAIRVTNRRIPYKNYFGLVVSTLLKCTQEIAIKGENKQLPGLGADTPSPGRKTKK